MKQKYYKGEKYIYLRMAYQLCKENGGIIEIGEDSGMVGGQNYYRRFNVIEYDGKEVLQEHKNSRGFVEFTRRFEITNGGKTVRDYIDEFGDNHGQRWNH